MWLIRVTLSFRPAKKQHTAALLLERGLSRLRRSDRCEMGSQMKGCKHDAKAGLRGAERILNAKHPNTLLSLSCLQLKSHRLDLLQDLIVGHQPLPHEHPPSLCNTLFKALIACRPPVAYHLQPDSRHADRPCSNH